MAQIALLIACEVLKEINLNVRLLIDRNPSSHLALEITGTCTCDTWHLNVSLSFSCTSVFAAVAGYGGGSNGLNIIRIWEMRSCPAAITFLLERVGTRILHQRTHHLLL